MMQVRAADRDGGDATPARGGAGAQSHVVGHAERAGRGPRWCATRSRCSPRSACDLQRAWSETHATACSGCATTRRARRRSTTASSTRAIRALSRPARVSIRARTSPHRSSARGAAADRDPARAGRQRPGRDGGGVRPRRLRGGRRAHERHHRGRASARGLQGLRGLRRLLLRRRAGRGRGLGEVDPLQRARARDEFEAFFGARRHLRARRLQRLPDDGEPEGDHPGRAATGRRSSATARSSSRRAS